MTFCKPLFIVYPVSALQKRKPRGTIDKESRLTYISELEISLKSKQARVSCQQGLKVSETGTLVWNTSQTRVRRWKGAFYLSSKGGPADEVSKLYE